MCSAHVQHSLQSGATIPEAMHGDVTSGTLLTVGDVFQTFVSGLISTMQRVLARGGAGTDLTDVRT